MHKVEDVYTHPSNAIVQTTGFIFCHIIHKKFWIMRENAYRYYFIISPMDHENKITKNETDCDVEILNTCIEFMHIIKFKE